MDSELKWLEDETRFELVAGAVQAVDGTERYTYEADGSTTGAVPGRGGHSVRKRRTAIQVARV